MTSVDALILAAMPEEAAAVAALCTDTRPVGHPFRNSDRVAAVRAVMAGASGSRANVSLVTTGIGTAAAAAVASWAINEFAPRIVINAGSCGGLGADIAVGTVVVGTEYAYSIADATAFGYAAGQVPGAPERFAFEAVANTAEPIVRACAEAGLTARSGLMLAGDAFVTAPIAEPMREKFPGALSADMETTAIAHSCALRDISFIAIRAVSDLCSPRAGEEFHVGLDVAAAHSARAVQIALPILRG